MRISAKENDSMAIYFSLITLLKNVNPEPKSASDFETYSNVIN